MTDQSPMQNETDDAALLRSYGAEGDADAVGILFQRHAKIAYRVALRVTRNSADAEDAVQSAFVQVLRNARLFRGGSDGFKPWLMAIVVNACRQKIRKRVRRTHREEMYSADIPGTTQLDGTVADEQDERLALVKQTLDRLPVKYRVALWLHHGEGLPFREVASILSVGESTVRSRASRGIDALRRLLNRSGLALPANTYFGLAN